VGEVNGREVALGDAALLAEVGVELGLAAPDPSL
jgi:hypothetical protein